MIRWLPRWAVLSVGSWMIIHQLSQVMATWEAFMVALGVVLIAGSMHEVES